MVTALLIATPAFAQDKTAEIDKIFSWTKPNEPGCAVAVSQNGKIVVNKAYGSADLERDVPVSPNAVFDIGSTHKQFVAAAVLLLVEEKRLSLSDDIRKYISELPDYGHKITIDHLLTHTSGIRDWTGLLPLAAGNPDALTVILRQRNLNFAPGEEWSYSNSGYVLLKEIVARASGTSFGEFARKRLFEPLGMKATSYSVAMREVTKNRALAYEKEGGRWKVAMRLDNDRGGGGILSTTGDLVIRNDALTNNRLGAFVSEKLQEPAKLNNGRQIKYARGLIVDSYRGVKEVSHSGGAAGYHSWLGRHPAQGLSTVVLCNSDTVAATALARRVIDLFVPATGAQVAENTLPPIAADGIDVAGLDLNSKAGLYFSEGAEPLRLVVDRGRLRVAGGPALVAQSKDRFKRWGASVEFMSQDEFEMRFLSPGEFELKSMEGKTTRYRRTQPYAHTADELKAFAGRYESTEIGTVFQIEPKGDGLQVRLEHTPSRSLEFKPVARDTFQLSRVAVRFHRDKSGKAVALDYSNPLLRNVKFTRLSDR
jgi:CubicO group peptidase (beta-lactamase class C family)